MIKISKGQIEFLLACVGYAREEWERSLSEESKDIAHETIELLIDLKDGKTEKE